MSCSLISWKTFAIEIPHNINPNIKCNLCKNNLIQKCIDCNTIKKCSNSKCNNYSSNFIYLNKKYCFKHKPKHINNCKIIKGVCDCLYHYHCIEKWKQINNNCPNCENIWNFKEIF